MTASAERRWEPWAADTAASVVDRARTWLGSPALANLVAALGGSRAAMTDVNVLVEWSEATLDTRDGRERHDVANVSWPDEWIDAVIDAGADLGLMATPPPQRANYDTTFVLGGTTLGNALRTRLAAELVHSGVDLGTLIVLTADRVLSGHETREAPPGERTETANAMRNAAENLGTLRPAGDETVVEGGRERLFTRRDGPVLRLLVAGGIDGVSRPSTAEAMRFALARTAVSDREHVLIVSSAIYAPFQFFRVAPLLFARDTRYVELVGTPTDASGNRRRLAQRLAQETHAAIHAAADLLSSRPG